MSTWLNASIAWWSSLYGNHTSVALTVTFLHVAGVVVAGGTALTVDRQILLGRRAGQSDRRFLLGLVGDAHKPVIVALSVTVLSGLLLVVADADTFLHSRVFWVKMAVFALLAVNGGVVMLAGKAACRSDGGSGWRLLAGASVASAMLWLTVVLLGEWLRVAA